MSEYRSRRWASISPTAVQHGGGGTHPDGDHLSFLVQLRLLAQKPNRESRVDLVGKANGVYMTRRRWDYFLRHLLGAEPPAGHRIELRRPPSL